MILRPVAVSPARIVALPPCDAALVDGLVAVPPNPERLTVSGTNLVSTLTSSTVLLRCLNWGRWGYVRAGDGALVVSWGVNCVRIPLRWDGVYSEAGTDSRDDGSPGHVNPVNLAEHDRMMDEAEAAGLWIIPFIDSNCGQNGLQDAEHIAYCDPGGIYPNGHNFWRDTVTRDLYKELWQFMAVRNRNRARIALVEPLPEPGPMGISESLVRTFYSEMAAIIRPTGINAPFLVGAKSYSAPDIDQCFNAAEPDFVSTANLFTFTGQTQAENLQSLTDRMTAITAHRTAHNRPVFVQQWGAESFEDPTRLYQNYTANLLNANNVGGAYWQMDDGNDSGSGFGVYYTVAGNRVEKTARLNDLKTHWAGGTI